MVCEGLPTKLELMPRRGVSAGSCSGVLAETLRGVRLRRRSE